MNTTRNCNILEELQMQNKKVFETGCIVQEDGQYICAPCGDRKSLKKGDIFPRCYSCLAGQEYKGDRFFKDMGVWEKV